MRLLYIGLLSILFHTSFGMEKMHAALILRSNTGASSNRSSESGEPNELAVRSSTSEALALLSRASRTTISYGSSSALFMWDHKLECAAGSLIFGGVCLWLWLAKEKQLRKFGKDFSNAMQHEGDAAAEEHRGFLSRMTTAFSAAISALSKTHATAADDLSHAGARFASTRENLDKYGADIRSGHTKAQRSMDDARTAAIITRARTREVAASIRALQSGVESVRSMTKAERKDLEVKLAACNYDVSQLADLSKAQAAGLLRLEQTARELGSTVEGVIRAQRDNRSRAARNTSALQEVSRDLTWLRGALDGDWERQNDGSDDERTSDDEEE